MASASSISLMPCEAYGVKGSLQDGLHFVEGFTFVYVASHCLIEKNARDLRAQGRFVAGTTSMCGISAIVVSPDHKSLAVAEIAMQQDVNSGVAAASPMISVYSASKLSRKQSLISASAGSHQYVSLSYTCDGKHLAALGGPPEWLLQLWHVRKTEVLTSVKTVTLNSTAAYQVRCCPVDKDWFTVCGDGFAKTYKMVDTDLRQVSTDYTNQEGRKVLCHSWIPSSAKKSAEDGESEAKGEKGKNGKSKVAKKAYNAKMLKGNEVVNCGCVYALDSGELLYVNRGEVIAKIPLQEPGDDVCVAQSILPYSKGLICGESGKVSIYDHDKTQKTYNKVRSIKVEETNARIHGLALSSEEDVLMCLLSTNRLIHLNFDDIESMSADSVSHKVQTQSYHQAFITGMDICLLKPFVVTCSKDKSVRVWNFEERSCELLKFFPSEALSVSIHPNGLYLLVGCVDCLFLMSMIIDDLSLWKEFPFLKGCTDCAFSRGGQCFAAATGNVVHIISTYTGQTTGHLRGHSNKVQSIWWAYDDFSIVTAGMDGAIYEWSLPTWERSREFVTEGCSQMCAIGTRNSTRFLSTTSDCKLRELNREEVFHTIQSNVNLTQIVQFVEGSVVFVGTEHGAIRAYDYPLTGSFREVKLFAASVVKVCLSSDNFLFCASMDGSMMMFDVRIHGSQHHGWRDDVLIPKADLEESMKRIRELDIQAVLTEKLREQKMKCFSDQRDEKIKDIKNHNEHSVKVARDELVALSMEISAMALNAERKLIDVLAIHAKHLKDMEDVYNRMTLVEMSRYNEILRSKDAAKTHWAQQMESLSKEHEVALQEIMEVCEAKLEGSREVLEKSKETKGEITLDLEEIRKVVEEDFNIEIDEKREQYELKLMIAEEEIQKVLGENGILKHKYGLFQKDIDISFAELSDLVEQKKELYEIIRDCQHNTKMLENNLEESEELIQEKNKRINALKRTNQELEKFKWILDYKLMELKESIRPSRIEAAELRDRMGKMESELLRSRHTSKDKEILLRTLKAKLHAADVEKQRILLTISKTTRDFRDFQLDFHELSQKNESFRVLKRELLKVFRKHVKGKLGVKNFEKSPEDGAFYQRELLEKKVKSLEHDIEEEKKNNVSLRLRLVKHNRYLVGHTEVLREEVRSRGRTPMTSAPSSRFNSRPTTSDGKDQLSSVRKQVAELQLQLSARCAQVELLQEQLIDSSLSGELWKCVDGKKLPLTRR